LVYDLPFGHGQMFLNKNWLVNEAVGGWQVSSTMILQSGNPFTVYSSQNTFEHAGSAFPNYSGAPLYPTHKTYKQWFNPAAFTLPADYTFGNVRRNSLYGPGVELVNISAGKKFDIHESMKLQIRADATNAFNHATFGLPGGGLATATDSSGAQTQFAGQAYNAGAGGFPQISGLTSGARLVQVSARFEF
jgi:hypothetical protein